MTNIHSLKEFNARLKKEGIDIEMVKGDGYFWFASNVGMLEVDSVYVCHFTHMRPEQWGWVFNDLIESVREYLGS